MKELTGVVSVVTGGASGLGKASAGLLARAGARVAIVDRDTKAANETASNLGGHSFACDVADADAAAAVMSAIVERLGAPRILVNCAGIGRAGRILARTGTMPLEAFSEVVSVNLIGSFNMLRLAAAEMAKTGPLEDGERGVIISTASVAAFEGQLGQAAYAASKGGIVAMTLPAARELAQFGIRVLAIAPGLFRTPLLGNLPEAVQESLPASVPFPNRLGFPEEFADLVLACVKNAYLNGEVIRLDGALRLPPK